MQVPPRINRLVGQAMHDYAMLADGDRILVAVSGGVDSLVLALLLHVWQKKAPIRYELLPAHVCMDGTPENPGPSALAITKELAKSGLGLELLAALRPGPDSAADGSREHAAATCFACARNRRNSLFRAARHLGCNKVALGHHQDDVIETFLLNLTCAGNISTMGPKQRLFRGQLTLIRPLAYVEKADIAALAAMNRLQPVASSCPLAGRTRRETMHNLAFEIYRRVPGAKGQIFAALGNVRADYLLGTRPVVTDVRLAD